MGPLPVPEAGSLKSRCRGAAPRLKAGGGTLPRLSRLLGPRVCLGSWPHHSVLCFRRDAASSATLHFLLLSLSEGPSLLGLGPPESRATSSGEPSLN